MTKADWCRTSGNGKKPLYIYALGMPEAKAPFDIHQVIENNIRRVSVVGSGVDVKWTKNEDVLFLTTPASSDMDELATVFKVDLE
ncbi:MAG TPA: hypothetical protein PLK12_00770 [Prolixibacteraceae bacterium]|nr:hypothetical protein [Prolixibacteraceae bacterium]